MSVRNLIDKLDASGTHVFWYGGASDELIEDLETAVATSLPPSFADFLRECGGGGEENSEISGIAPEGATVDERGTVWGDTSRCRSEFGLPRHLLAIYFNQDEICWCLDLSRRAESGEVPVVSYSVFRQEVERDLAASFQEFFEEYVKLRTS